jgi:hypothetical protein
LFLLEAINERYDRVVIEDDGRACYAYLLVGDEYVSDVWLYNVAEAPAAPDWTLPDAKERLPFLNPAGLAAQESFLPLKNASEARIVWGELDGCLQAAIHLRGEYHALLMEGEKPGWCRLVDADGPVARILRRTHS